MVVAYQVGQTHQKGLCIRYQQHMHYIQASGLSCNPRSLFQADILHAAGHWLEYGDRIIIFIDINKHIITGTLPKEFQRLGLLEATHLNWEGSEPRIFVFGKGKPIDGVYHSPELKITLIMQLSFHKGVGDHKTTIIDVTTKSVIGKFERKVVTPQARRLSTRNEKSMKEYIKWTTQQCRLHKLQTRIKKVVDSKSRGEMLPAHINEMERVDTQKSEIQLGREQQCRKIRCPPQPFSPSIRGIDLRRRAYVNMEAWHKGDKTRNGNVFRAAARAGIKNPNSLTAKECSARAAACCKLIKKRGSEAHQLQRTHLYNRYELASDLRDRAKKAKIKEIIKREEQRDGWRRIKRATGDPQTGATNFAQRKEGDKIVDILEAHAMNTEIQRVTEMTFELANNAPIQKSSLQEKVGFCVSTAFAKDLLQVKVAIPSDIDKTTIESIQKLQQLWKRLQPYHGHSEITPGVYQYYWGGANKSTLSALSKIHFSHWKAWSTSRELTKLACSQLDLITRTGIHPTRWGHGLQVLLEKVP